MIIELLGVPASGKSTYAKSLCKKVNAVNPLDVYLYNDSRLCQNINKLKLSISIITCRPVFTVKLIIYIYRLEYSSIADKAKMILYFTSVLGAIHLGKRRYRTIVVDEGVCQLFWGLLYYSKSNRDRILDVLMFLKDYIGENILYINPKCDIVLNRLLKRTTEGGASLVADVRKDEEALTKGYKCIDYVIDKLHGIGYASRIKEILINEDSIYNK